MFVVDVVITLLTLSVFKLVAPSPSLVPIVPKGFNGTWHSGNSIIYHDDRKVKSYDVDTDSIKIIMDLDTVSKPTKPSKQYPSVETPSGFRSMSAVIVRKKKIYYVYPNMTMQQLSDTAFSFQDVVQSDKTVWVNGDGTKLVLVEESDASSASSHYAERKGGILLLPPSNVDHEVIVKLVRFMKNDSIAILWANARQTYMLFQKCINATCTEIFQYSQKDGWIEEQIYLLFNENSDSFVIILPQLVNGVRYKQIVQVTQDPINYMWRNQSRTNTPYTVTKILHWTADDIIWYTATHVNDSAEQHVYFVNADGYVTCFSCDLVRPDGAKCLYNDAHISPDGSNLALNCMGPSIPQVLIYNSNGIVRKVWENNVAIARMLMNLTGPKTIRLSVPVAPGLPEADVLIQLPDDYEKRNKIPLLVSYPIKPDTAEVTKEWKSDFGFIDHITNKLGMAIAYIDGRGTGLRGVDNMFAIRRRLGTVDIDDRINVTRYLLKTFPWLDSRHLCGMGTEYGGYAASMALVRGGDVFQCAIAIHPIIDWQFYYTAFTKRYMDLIDENIIAYSLASLSSSDVAKAFINKKYLVIQLQMNGNENLLNETQKQFMIISKYLQDNNLPFTQMIYGNLSEKTELHFWQTIIRFLEKNNK